MVSIKQSQVALLYSTINNNTMAQPQEIQTLSVEKRLECKTIFLVLLNLIKNAQ